MTYLLEVNLCENNNSSLEIMFMFHALNLWYRVSHQSCHFFKKFKLLQYHCNKPCVTFRDNGILDITGKKTFSSLLLSPEDRFLHFFQPTFSKVNAALPQVEIYPLLSGQGGGNFIRDGFEAACTLQASSTFQV